MIDPRSAQPRFRSGNAGDFRSAFIRRVHQLLQMGYARLIPATHSREQEPAITGEIVRCIEEVFDDLLSPKWVNRFAIADDPPVNDGKRKGKKRKRVDIVVESTTHRPRPRFSFEAKRLGRRKPVSKYLGTEGLGCFLRSDYAAREDVAGMLGYVQSGLPHDWAIELENELSRACTTYGFTSDTWERHSFARGPTHTYRSRHDRQSPNTPIEIYHTLLLFY